VYKEHHDLYLPDSILLMNSRTMKCVRNTAHLEKRHAYRVLVEKHEGKRPLERPRCR